MFKKNFKILSLCLMLSNFHIQAAPEDNAAAAGVGLFLFTATALTVRSLNKSHEKENAKATDIQKIVRGKQARNAYEPKILAKYQEFVAVEIEKIKNENKKIGTTNIQKIVRGYQTRNKQNQKQLSAIKRNNTPGFRTDGKIRSDAISSSIQIPKIDHPCSYQKENYQLNKKLINTEKDLEFVLTQWSNARAQLEEIGQSYIGLNNKTVKKVQAKNKMLEMALTSNSMMTKKHEQQIADLTDQRNHQEKHLNEYRTSLIALQTQAKEITQSKNKAKRKAGQRLEDFIALQQKLVTEKEAITAVEIALEEAKKALAFKDNIIKTLQNERAEAKKNSIQNTLYAAASQGLEITTKTILPSVCNVAGGLNNILSHRGKNSPTKSTNSESIDEGYMSTSFDDTISNSVDNYMQDIKKLPSNYNRTLKIAEVKARILGGLEEDTDLEIAMNTINNHAEYNANYKYTQMVQNAAEVLNPKNFRNDFKRVEGLDQSIQDEINNKAQDIITRCINRANTEQLEISLTGFEDLSPTTQDIVETALINANENPTEVTDLLQKIKNKQHQKA